MVCLEIVGGLPDKGCWVRWAGWTGGTRGPPLLFTGREVGPEDERFVALYNIALFKTFSRIKLIYIDHGNFC